MLNVFLSILLGFCLFGLVACVYMAVRNNKVYDYRVKVLYESMERYNNLPSYDKMLYKFWVWPMSRFEKK